MWRVVIVSLLAPRIGQVPVRGLAQIGVPVLGALPAPARALSSQIGMFGVEGGQVSSTDIAQNAYVSFLSSVPKP